MPRVRPLAPLRRSAQLLLVALACLLAVPAVSAAGTPPVLITKVDGTITPVVADHLQEGVRIAERERHAAYVIEMDTPGGLLQSTREIVQDFLASDIPVVVYVTPSGARAASAGAYIAMSAHVAAMAPGTHIGAGTPVTGEGEEASDKVVNDAVAFAVSIAEQRGRSTDFARDMVREGEAVSDREAVRTDVVDLVAPSRTALLTELDGRRVVVGPEGGEHEVVLHTADARTVEHDLGFFGEVRQLLASPELAFLFLSIGTLAVIYELANPGIGFAGAIGLVLLVLGFVALSVLPFHVGGLLLLVLAAGLFAAEVLTPGVGVFAAGGTVALVFAGILLFRGELGVDPAVLWPTAVVVGGGSLLAGRLAWRARQAQATTGAEGLLGQQAVVVRADGGTGQVWLEGAWWTVRDRTAPVTAGQHVRVVDIDGLDLIVERADTPGGPIPEQEDGTWTPD
ncbi:nodulation protein NfeD [Streptomyces sp. NPDC059862]|uniref:NfeD family protein n=1 Tax=Streptomyces sp. NPDC059862 TaxID=3346975 RepID=UPI0036677368